MRLNILLMALVAVQAQAHEEKHFDMKRWCIFGFGTTCTTTSKPPPAVSTSSIITADPTVNPSSSSPPPSTDVAPSESAITTPSPVPSSSAPPIVDPSSSTPPVSSADPSSTPPVIDPSSPSANASVPVESTSALVNATPTVSGLLAAPVEVTAAPVTTWAGGKVMNIPLPTPLGEAGKPAWGSFFSYSQPPIPDVTASADPAVFTAAGPDFIAQAPQVRKYTFNLGYSAGYPDGFLRSVMTINNQYPGPLVEANKGDTLEITVNNGLDVPQSFHWHGIRQFRTNAMDGVPGVSQCAIPPGGSFTYRFQVPVETGTFWYHSHYGNTMADGLVGGMLIHSKDDPLKRGVDFTEDRVLYLSDWEADQSHVIEAGLRNLFKGYRGLPLVVAPESILINGLGQTDCSHRQVGTRCFYMPKQEVRAPQGAQVRFRLINTGSHAMVRFSIDNHKLKVIEVDDTPVEGVWVSEVPVNTGQRYSVVVSMDQGAPGSSFWIRANAATFCINPLQKVTAQGILRYTDASGNGAETDEPTSSAWNDLASPQFGDCVDLDEKVTLKPRTIEPVSKSVGETGYMNNLFGVFVDRVEHTPYIGFGMNGVAFTNYINNPLLSQIQAGKRLNGANVASLTFNRNGWADIVINVIDPPPLSHPFHLHGRPFHIVARGWGYVGPLTKWLHRVNTNNPLRRDTITIPHNSWAILRVQLDNPGVWPLHCHIGWHLSVGKLAIVVIGEDQIKTFDKPADWQALCDGQNPNEIGPAKRYSDYMPPQGRASDIEDDISGTNRTMWPALGKPYTGSIQHPLLSQHKVALNAEARALDARAVADAE